MAARQAVGIVNRRELEAGNGDRDELAGSYEECHLRAERAAASGYVDEVIEPSATRERLDWALRALERR
jgi:acetyl-CoA carboxylase carboxyltransferase component